MHNEEKKVISPTISTFKIIENGKNIYCISSTIVYRIQLCKI